MDLNVALDCWHKPSICFMTCLLSIELVLQNIYFCTCSLIFCMCLLRTERSGTPMFAEEWPPDSSHSVGCFLDFSIPSAGLYKLFNKTQHKRYSRGWVRGLSWQGSLPLCWPPESDSWAPRQKERTDSYELWLLWAALTDPHAWAVAETHEHKINTRINAKTLEIIQVAGMNDVLNIG